MRPLLELTDPRYLRRLVRALNREHGFNGFYTPVNANGEEYNARCNRARYSKGVLQVREPGGRWFTPTMAFHDPSGEDIVANRSDYR